MVLNCQGYFTFITGDLFIARETDRLTPISGVSRAKPEPWNKWIFHLTFKFKILRKEALRKETNKIIALHNTNMFTTENLAYNGIFCYRVRYKKIVTKLEPEWS